MTEKGPSPPYEFEPGDKTEGKYRVATILVAIFVVVLLAVAVFVVVTEPASPNLEVEETIEQAPGEGGDAPTE